MKNAKQAALDLPGKFEPEPDLPYKVYMVQKHNNGLIFVAEYDNLADAVTCKSNVDNVDKDGRVCWIELNRQQILSTPGAEWRVLGQPDPHEDRYDCERAALTLGKFTDDELANGVFMNADQPLDIDRMMPRDPSYHPPIVWLTAAKDRIRWLSRALEGAIRQTATRDAPSDPALPAWFDTFLTNVCELSDRNSPPEEADAIVATLEELSSCALNAIEHCAASAPKV